jgi:acyl-CoA synthetase (NDP forming)
MSLDMNTSIDFTLCEAILERAARDGRFALLEHEGLEFLEAMGLNPPQRAFIPAGAMVAQEVAPRTIVKVVSPLIAHKTDVGGVRAVGGTAEALTAAMEEMLNEVPGRLASLKADSKEVDEAEARRSIRGFLIAERLPFDGGFGGELLIGARSTEGFGPVVVLGPGGIMSEMWAKNIAFGRGTAVRSAVNADAGSLSSMLDETLLGDFLLGRTRTQIQLAEPTSVIDIIARFAQVAAHFSSCNPKATHHLVELEVNPFLVSRGELRPVDVLLRFEPPDRRPAPMPTRPLEQVKKLLCPKSIGIIGVSEKGLNIGRIILGNLLRDGYPKQEIFIVKPGFKGSIEGCACFEDVASLPKPVDLLVVSVEAPHVPELVARIEHHEAAAGVLLIPGGMGEKDGSGTIESRIVDEIRKSRSKGGGAVYNGGNCIGIISQPGGCDTNFVPSYKLPRCRGSLVNTAIVSQSGAFIDSWLSKQHLFGPRYAISIGNQIDITISDYLRALREEDGVEVVAVYVEGFRPLDGLETINEIAALCASGREVVVYKAGRTSAGRASTAGHTASIAGDFEVAEALLREAGAWVAETFEELEHATKLLSFLHGRPIRGRRIGAVSNAGFEVVGFADNTESGPKPLELPEFSAATVARIEDIFARAKIADIVDVRNPLDATPMSDDACFADYVEAILSDPNIDILVVSVVPLTWLMSTLPKNEGAHLEDVEARTSIAHRLAALSRKTEKPIVATCNSGRLYDRMVDILEEASIPVFREADHAMRLLAKLMDLRTRLHESVKR